MSRFETPLASRIVMQEGKLLAKTLPPLAPPPPDLPTLQHTRVHLLGSTGHSLCGLATLDVVQSPKFANCLTCLRKALVNKKVREATLSEATY